MHLMIVYVSKDFFLILSREHSIKMSCNVQTHYLHVFLGLKRINTISGRIKMKTKTCYIVDDLGWYHKKLHEACFLHKYLKIVCFDYVAIKKIMSLTKGGRKNNGPAFSAGQWPSLACKAEKKWTALFNESVAFSYVISSPSSIFTGGIVCLKFFSLRNCNHFGKEISSYTFE
jgi:hypothetical protein